MLNLHKSYISEFDTINQEIKAEQIEFQNENDDDHWLAWTQERRQDLQKVVWGLEEHWEMEYF